MSTYYEIRIFDAQFERDAILHAGLMGFQVVGVIPGAARTEVLMQRARTLPESGIHYSLYMLDHGVTQPTEAFLRDYDSATGERRSRQQRPAQKPVTSSQSAAQEADVEETNHD